MDVKFVIAITLGCIVWLTIIPISCWWSYRFYINKQNIIIQKRYPTLTLTYSIFTIFHFGIDPWLYILTHAVSDSTGLYHQNKSVVALFYLSHTTYFLLIVGPNWIILLRYWMIYYDVHWTRSSLNKQWKIHINHLHINKDWFISHKSTFGNDKWCLRRVCILYVILMIVATILTGVPLLHFLRILIVIIANIGILFIIPLFWNIRKFNDSFYIIKELKMLFRVILVMLVLYVTVSCTLPYFYDQLVHVVFDSIFTTVCVFIFFYIQTGLILRQMSIRDKAQITETNTDGNLKTTLSNPKLFELFMKHLSKEWSMETLLSYIELTQLQHSIKQHYMDEYGEEMVLTQLQQSLLSNDEVIKSFIVYHDNINDILNEYSCKSSVQFDENDKMNQFKIRSFVLYLKYIQGIDLQINLSYQQKEELVSVMSNLNYFMNNVNIKPVELFDLYAKVIHEQVKLLNHSHFRLKLPADT